MEFVREFKYALIVLLFVLSVGILFSFTKSIMLQFIMSLLSIIAGSAMVMLGFWGSDFAFGVVIGHIKQGKEKGLIKGAKKKVYVPFMRNYTPLEWWNLNWYLTFLGCVLLALGMFLIGIILGVNCYATGYCEWFPLSF